MTACLQLLSPCLVRYSSSRGSLTSESLVPVQHAHSAQGVPVAGPAFALVHAEVEIADAGVDQFARVWVLERQPAFGVTLGAHQVDGLGHARIGLRARGAQEVEPAQRVVV